MNSATRRLPLLTCLIAVSVSILTSCVHSDSNDFTLIEKHAVITKVDIGEKGLSKGDQVHIEANVTRNGKDFGVVYGEQSVQALPSDFGRSADHQVSHSRMIFKLKDGYIIVLGILDSPPSEWRLKPNNSSASVIVGGTGKYEGARGELITKYRSDSIIEYHFSFAK